MLLELNLSRTFKRIIKKDVIGISWMEMKRKSCSWIKNLNGKGWEKKKRKFTWREKAGIFKIMKQQLHLLEQLLWGEKQKEKIVATERHRWRPLYVYLACQKLKPNDCDCSEPWPLFVCFRVLSKIWPEGLGVAWLRNLYRVSCYPTPKSHADTEAGEGLSNMQGLYIHKLYVKGARKWCKKIKKDKFKVLLL